MVAYVKARIADKYTSVDDKICVEDLSQIMDEMGYRFIEAVKFLLKVKKTYHELKLDQVTITEQEVQALPKEEAEIVKLPFGGC